MTNYTNGVELMASPRFHLTTPCSFWFAVVKTRVYLIEILWPLTTITDSLL